MLNKAGMLKKMPVNAGESDAPTERAMAVTPERRIVRLELQQPSCRIDAWVHPFERC
jgi:hypothetical protein